jgi:hypothetical protein
MPAAGPARLQRLWRPIATVFGMDIPTLCPATTTEQALFVLLLQIQNHAPVSQTHVKRSQS